jgi:hypothetical protein
MAREVLDAVEKLLQFTTNRQGDTPVTGKDLAPILTAVATALNDLDTRLRASSARPAANPPSSKPPLARR